MATTTIYVVMPNSDETFPICAYTNENDALAEAAQYDAYALTQPRLYIDTNDIAEQQRIMTEHKNAVAAWEQAHPAGQQWAWAMTFMVEPILLHTDR